MVICAWWRISVVRLGRTSGGVGEGVEERVAKMEGLRAFMVRVLRWEARSWRERRVRWRRWHGVECGGVDWVAERGVWEVVVVKDRLV